MSSFPQDNVSGNSDQAITASSAVSLTCPCLSQFIDCIEAIDRELKKSEIKDAFSGIADQVRLFLVELQSSEVSIFLDSGVYGHRASSKITVLGESGLEIQGKPRGKIVVYGNSPLEEASQTILKHFLGCIANRIASHCDHLEVQSIFSRTIQTHEAIVITDLKGDIEQVNEAFTSITGYTAEDVVGKNPRLLKSGEHDAFFYKLLWDELIGKGSWSGEIWNRKKDGSLFLAWQSISVVPSAEGKPWRYVSVFMDITQRKRDQEWITQQADYDPLTDLPNRRFFRNRLDTFLEDASLRNRFGAVMFVDLDQFKSVNESMGHHIGDHVLKIVGQRLINCLQENDVVARLGGDEFVILVNDLGQVRSHAEKAIDVIAEKILRAFRAPFEIDSEAFTLGCSVGITLAPNGANSAHELLIQADAAMCHAKHFGRHSYYVYTPEIRRATDERMKLVHRLKDAIEENKLTLYYQPQFDDQNRLVGAEGLLRWIEDGQVVLSPPQIVKLAEHASLIHALGEWVIARACQDLGNWAEKKLNSSFDKLAVNISPRQFIAKDFAEKTLAILKSHNIEPRQIMLEVTEDALIEDIDGVVATMVRLRGEGLRFALDDFGTGFSPLYYLSRLPLSTLKIDQSFVRNLDNIRNTGIVSSIIALGHKLGFDLIAEGVETREQLDKLRSFGCRRFQGYLFSKPVTQEEFSRLMRTHGKDQEQ